MVLPYHGFICGCIVALNLFEILYKYHSFVHFCQTIYRFIEVKHRNCHMSQMANMYFSTWPMNYINSTVDEIVDNASVGAPENFVLFYGKVGGQRLDQIIYYPTVEEKQRVQRLGEQ